jgi:aspartyl-tRNA(Asn)/glutamyl-tRNA(Gln) amidotransferase subunit C
MSIDQETLHKLAHLARLEVKPEDEQKMLGDLSGMLAFVEKLQEVNTEGVLPLTSMTHEVNQMREDIVLNELSREQALVNAPVKDHQYFRVPKVIE